MGNVCEQLRGVVEDVPQKTALRDEEGELTYADLWQEVDAFAGALREYDVESGDIVAIATGFSRDAVIAVLGTLRNGSVLLPLPEHHSQSALADTLTTCAPEGIVATPDRNQTMYLAEDAVKFNCRVVTGSSQFGIDFDDFVGRTEEEEDEAGGGLWETVSRLGRSSGGNERPGLADYWEVIDRSSTDPAVLERIEYEDAQYAVYSHEQLQSSIDVARTPSGLRGGDVLVSTLPPTSTEAVTNVIGATLFGGSTLAVPESGEPAALTHAIDEHDAALPLTPTEELDVLIEAANDAATSLRSLGVLGATPQTDSLKTIDSELDASAFQIVGLPGAAGLTHATHGDDPFKPGSIGRPLPDIQLRILDGGECPPAESAESPSEEAVGKLYIAGERVSSTALDGELRGVGRENMRWTDTGMEAYRTGSGHCYLRDDTTV